MFGPIINTSAGQTLDASDLFAIAGSGATIGSGVTVGLGHVFYNVSAGASPGPISVTLTPSSLTTSLSDQNGSNVPINTLSNGSITINGASVPEASSLAMMLLAVPALAIIRWRSRG